MLQLDLERPPEQTVADSIYSLLRRIAERNPTAIAIAAPERQPLSYGRLLRQVEDTAHALAFAGLKRNDRVAVVLPNGPVMAVAFLGVASGATCAPLNPSYTEKEFDFYISDLNARALVVLSGMASPAREVARKRRIPVIELTPAVDGEAGLFALGSGGRSTANTGNFAGPSDTALVLHTSGTTSRPKIVPLTHANLCHSAANIAATLGSRRRTAA